MHLSIEVFKDFQSTVFRIYKVLTCDGCSISYFSSVSPVRHL